jgi:excisionase family DNA binding protein
VPTMTNDVAVTSPPLLWSIPETCGVLRLGRSKVYELLAEGELEVVHIGRRALVTAASVEAFVERLRVAGADHAGA